MRAGFKKEESVVCRQKFTGRKLALNRVVNEEGELVQSSPFDEVKETAEWSECK